MIDPALNGTLPWTKSCFVCGEANRRGLRLRSRVENGVVVLTYRPMTGAQYRLSEGDFVSSTETLDPAVLFES
jgi:hypothetical protein